MKAKFLRRIENERTRVVKVVFECDEKDAFKLEKGRSYAIGELRRPERVEKQVCGNCKSWERNSDEIGLPQGVCYYGGITFIYEDCDKWEEGR